MAHLLQARRHLHQRDKKTCSNKFVQALWSEMTPCKNNASADIYFEILTVWESSHMCLALKARLFLIFLLLFLEFILLDIVFHLAPLPDFTSVRFSFLSCPNIAEDLTLCYCMKTEWFSVTVMWGIQGLKSFSAKWLAPKQRSLPWIFDTTGSFHSEDVILESCFSVLVLFLDIWVLEPGVRYKHKRPLLSAGIHSEVVSVLVVRGAGYMTGFVLVGKRGGSAGWKRCLLHNSVGYLSASVEWRRCDIPGQAVPEMRQIQTHCLSGLYRTLCFSWRFALCYVTVTFAPGIIFSLHPQTFLKYKYCLLLQAYSCLR